MRYLVDTGVWLWALSDPDRLSRETRATLTSSNHEGFLSAVTAWEIAIKFRAGKLKLPERPESYVPGRMTALGLKALDVTHAHALAVASLPMYHRDPFDRLLVAQAQLEDLVLITADAAVQRYQAKILWAAK